MPPRQKSTKAKNTSKSKTKAVPEDDSDQDNYQEDDSAANIDSDALDDEDEEDTNVGSKRKRAAKSNSKKPAASRKKPRQRKPTASEEEDDDDEDDLKEGQTIVGTVVQAPKTGRVPAGQISRNTLNFLGKLQDPKCNDREWFKLHDPVYRQAEKEWKDFIEVVTDMIAEADPHIPPLPAKDVIHRIYRDVRFSNDKTPYKRNLSASFSRTGRKGGWAGYHLAIRPGGSILAAGSWAPSKSHLDNIRANILRSPDRLRAVLAEPAFVDLFPGSVFGAEDELKTAPKGCSKDHPDIDLMRCRSFAVSHKFTDEEVLSEKWTEEIVRVVGILRPLVHCLNDMMGVPPTDDADEEEEE